jgi:adenylate kinase family enzyme
VKRLNIRSKTDDKRIYDRDTDTIIHRLETYESCANKVREYYKNKNKYYSVNGDEDVEVVFGNVCDTVDKALKS